MASLLHKIATFNNIQAGQSLTRSWTKIDPAIAVWYIQAIPRESSFTSAQPPEQSVEVEVTRVSRKLKRALSTNEVQDYSYEHEVWYTIKNIGTREVDFDVYASIIS